MSFRISKLENGSNLISIKTPDSLSVTLMALVRSGPDEYPETFQEYQIYLPSVHFVIGKRYKKDVKYYLKAMFGI